MGISSIIFIGLAIGIVLVLLIVFVVFFYKPKPRQINDPNGSQQRAKE